MAIELLELWPVHAKKAGGETFEVAAGKFLKIETSPNGTEYLNAQVPVGKTWTVSVVVDIAEVDA